MISIVIPAYNRANLLPRAIASVLNQTSAEWELVIVDDGSTDTTPDVVKQYGTDTRIKYIKKHNSGASHSRNVGVETASHEWVTFLDSDDEALPTWIERLLEKFRAGNRVISCGLKKVDSTGNEIETLIPKAGKGIYLSGAYAFEKTIFTTVGGFDLKLPSGQHTELSIRMKNYLRQHEITICVIADPLVKVHIHEGNRIRNSYEAKYQGTLIAYQSEQFGNWMKFDKARSRYESIIAFNAFKTGRFREARRFSFKAFRSKPNVKELLRPVRYCIRFI
jgi:glycosyltransferase involved in cell wall biosynthesis